MIGVFDAPLPGKAPGGCQNTLGGATAKSWKPLGFHAPYYSNTVSSSTSETMLPYTSSAAFTMIFLIPRGSARRCLEK